MLFIHSYYGWYRPRGFPVGDCVLGFSPLMSVTFERDCDTWTAKWQERLLAVVPWWLICYVVVPGTCCTAGVGTRIWLTVSALCPQMPGISGGTSVLTNKNKPRRPSTMPTKRAANRQRTVVRSNKLVLETVEQRLWVMCEYETRTCCRDHQLE
jgi:hypothetical protein